MKVNTSIYKKHINYVPKDYRDESDAPVFILQLLSAKQLAQLDDSLTKINADGSMILHSGSYALTALKMSLKDWNNIIDENDQPVIFESTDEIISLIPASVRQEVANFVVSESRFPDESLEGLGKR